MQTERGIDTTKATNCKIAKGPFMYSGFIMPDGKAQGYVKREFLSQGSGYWINVENDCMLISEEEEEAPPAPPEESDKGTATQTTHSGILTPQGGRGRRFIGDAG